MLLPRPRFRTAIVWALLGYIAERHRRTRLFGGCPPGTGRIAHSHRGPFACSSPPCIHDHRVVSASLYASHIISVTLTTLSLIMDDHPDDSFSDADSDIFSTHTATSSSTSFDLSMRSGSPAPSLYSVTSSIRAASFRHEYGRGLNNYSDVYQLPADDEELDRLGIVPAKFLLNLSQTELNRQTT